MYLTKTKLTFFILNDKKIVSIESLFPSSNWAERESAEMFGYYHEKKIDNRLLLLDYSKNEAPLLKNFPTEGYEDVYYNFYNNQIAYFSHEFIEL